VGDYDELRLILDAHRTPSPFGEEGPNEMEWLAIASYRPGDKFKHVTVPMRGINGNPLVIVGWVKEHLRRAGATPTELWLFVRYALAGDYDNVLATAAEWVTLTDEREQPKRDAWDALVNAATKKNED